MAMKIEDKKRLLAELFHIAEETRDFNPPYIPHRYKQDVANSDPTELIYKYTLAKDIADGFERLWRERRLDLAVENVAGDSGTRSRIESAKPRAPVLPPPASMSHGRYTPAEIRSHHSNEPGRSYGSDGMRLTAGDVGLSPTTCRASPAGPRRGIRTTWRSGGVTK